jgi:engulfment and cell motility protein 1
MYVVFSLRWVLKLTNLQQDSTSTTFQPFFLDFPKVHSLATHFFIRMWSESGAATGDFTRVVALVRSQ